MAMSTSVSDFVFAAACGWACAILLRQRDPVRRYAAIGMALMAVAASLGGLRYAGVEALVPAHRMASLLAAAVAPGCFGMVALALARGWSRRVVELGLLALLLGFVVGGLVLRVAIWPTAIGSLAVVAMVIIGTRARSRAGLELGVGALILALAGLVIGDEGTIGPLRAIDVFHVALTLAHLSIAAGLVGLRSNG
jgi:hypothetical protein